MIRTLHSHIHGVILRVLREFPRVIHEHLAVFLGNPVFPRGHTNSGRIQLTLIRPQYPHLRLYPLSVLPITHLTRPSHLREMEMSLQTMGILCQNLVRTLMVRNCGSIVGLEGA